MGAPEMPETETIVYSDAPGQILALVLVVGPVGYLAFAGSMGFILARAGAACGSDGL